MENIIDNNIFEGAKFGDKFLMQCGKIAIYYGIDAINGKHIIIGEGDPNYKYRYIDGRCFTDITCDYDIVSRYQEPIDEKKKTIEKFLSLLDKAIEEWNEPHRHQSYVIDKEGALRRFKQAMEEQK